MALVTTATVDVKGYINFLSSGKLYIDTDSIEQSTANPFVVSTVLVNGNNVITFPSGMRGCVITLDPASGVNKTFKGAPADTGILISSAGRGGTMLITMISALTQFVITCSAGDTVLTKFHFF